MVNHLATFENKKQVLLNKLFSYYYEVNGTDSIYIQKQKSLNVYRSSAPSMEKLYRRYNRALKNIEYLYNDLFKLNNFDNFLNSEILWRLSVSSTTSEIEYCFNKL